MEWLSLLEGFLRVFALLIMLASLIGLLIPIFPGLVVIWLVALVSMLLTGLSGWGWFLLVVLTILMLVGSVVDNLAMGAVARDKGAAWSSIGLALLAGVAGTVIFPPIGGLLAAPGVLYLMEYRRLNDRARAWEVVKAMALGWGWGVAARLGIGVLMVGMWGLWALANT